MNKNRTGPISDHDLQAYVEGRADARTQAAIEAAAVADPVLLERIAAGDPFAKPIRAAFDASLTAAPVDDLVADLASIAARPAPATAAVSGGRSIGWVVGVAGALAAASAAYLWTTVRLDEPRPAPPPIERAESEPRPAPATPPIAPVAPADEAPQETPVSPAAPPPDLPLPPLPPELDQPPIISQPRPAWLVAVADYIRLMTPETFAASRQTPAQLRASLAAVGRRASFDLQAVARRVPELRLQRAEILELNGRPLAQLAFLDAANRPVAICILLRAAVPAGLRPSEPSSVQEDELHGLNIAHWDIDRHGLLIIGRQTPLELRRLAERLRG
jgi:hypothetical protein